MSERGELSAWKRFWERGGWWKAVLLAAAYYGLYQLCSLLVITLFKNVWGEEGSASHVLLATGLPIVLGSLLLIAFAISLGWLKELFGPQPITGRPWMWIAVAAVLAINFSAALSFDWGKAGAPLVMAWLVTGLFIGFAEELLTRGFVVNLMRKAGHSEIAVAAVSAAVFAALHAGNFFTSDQGLSQTILQVGYTFGFGVCMYLALRVTGNLIWPILLHATTDPFLFLFGGYKTTTLLALIPAFNNYLIIVVGVVLLFFIRGHVEQRDALGIEPKLT